MADIRMIYDENVEGCFRFATDTELTAILILEAAICQIKNFPDQEFTHITNDCDAMALAERSTRLAMGISAEGRAL